MFILCLAGASVTLGLQNLLPHYLNRLGMEVSWAGKAGVILHCAERDRPVGHGRVPGQSLVAAMGLRHQRAGAAGGRGAGRGDKTCGRRATAASSACCSLLLSAGAGGFFLAMTGLTVLINHSGLTIALAFVAAILVSSFVSRWIRSTELRFEGFDFADETTRRRWDEFCRSGAEGARAASAGFDLAGRKAPDPAARLSSRSRQRPSSSSRPCWATRAISIKSR